jgi:hypothetical protein
MYQVSSKRNSRKARKKVDVHQNTFLKAYISTIDDSRRPLDSLSDMTNMELVQDGVVRPRPPLSRYGTQPTLPVIGRGKFKKNGERYLLWMLKNGADGKLYTQKDGGAFTAIAAAHTYDDEAWASCVQSMGNVYIYNGVDNLSYLRLSDNSVQTYTSLATPSISSVVKAGMAGSTYGHYYRVSANNTVGESTASVVNSVTSGKIRNDWTANTDYIDVTWGAVAGAVSYTIYYGTTSTELFELYTVDSTSVTFRDLGSISTNPYKVPPDDNSTEGAVFTYMYSDTRTSQIYGITADNKLYYSGPRNGAFVGSREGGSVPIDEDGDTQLNYVDGFRNGKGDPVITISARGAAGKGKLYHVGFESLQVGNQTIFYPNIYEANGQAGTYAPRATIKARDSLYYPTGQDFKSTGTSQNIVNILTTNRIDQGIEPDTNNISLTNLHKAVGLEYQDRLYFALPVGSTENNEIWYMDTARKNAWILRWTVAAKDMWLYEDNAGQTHFCILQDNMILEFTRTGGVLHEDNGTAFSSRVAFRSLKWDEDGISMAKIRKQYFKLLYPRGTIVAKSTGLTRKGVQQSTGTDSFTVTTTPTGYGLWEYGIFEYGADPGEIESYGKSIAVLEIRPKGLLAQADWEVLADTAGSDYILSAVSTKGFSLEDLILKA